MASKHHLQPGQSLFTKQVLLVQIVPSRWQPRATFDAGSLLELAESIRDNGLWNPILIFSNEDGEPELVAGERRVRASVAVALIMASPRWIAEHGDKLETAVAHVAEHGWKQFSPDLLQDIATAQILAHDVSDMGTQKLHQVAVAENIQRESLSLIEEARALQDLQAEHNYSQRDLAKLMNKSQGWVQQRLAIGGASPAVQEFVNTRVFTIAHVRALAGLPGPVQDAVARAAQKKLESEGDNPATTRKIEKLAKDVKTLLNAETWEPRPADDLPPVLRNGRVLLAHHLRASTPQTLGEVVSKLGQWGALEAKTKDAQEHEVARILAAWSQLDGRFASMPTIWEALAPGAGFTCDTCLWQEIHVEDLPGREAPAHYGCPRLAGETVKTCPRYVRQADGRWPQLVAVPWSITRYLPDQSHPDLHKVGNNFLAAPAAFVTICHAAAATAATAITQKQQAQSAGASAVQNGNGTDASAQTIVTATAPVPRDPPVSPAVAAEAKAMVAALKATPAPSAPPDPPSTVLMVRIVGAGPNPDSPVLVTIGHGHGRPLMVSGAYADLPQLIQSTLDDHFAGNEDESPEAEVAEEAILEEV